MDFCRKCIICSKLSCVFKSSVENTKISQDLHASGYNLCHIFLKKILATVATYFPRLCPFLIFCCNAVLIFLAVIRGSSHIRSVTVRGWGGVWGD